MVKKHKDTFLLSYFSVTKSTKSQQGGLAPSSFQTTGGVHELVARAMRGECVRQRGNAKVGSLATLYNFVYTTRANISHEEAEQIRARKLARPLKKRCGRDSNMRADGMEYIFFAFSVGYAWFYIVGRRLAAAV